MSQSSPQILIIQVKILGTDISARQAVVLRPIVVIVDALLAFPIFLASTIFEIMDQKQEPTRKFVWQALLSDCRVIFTRVRM